MTQNNELDLILDDLVVVGADIIGVGERIDKLYEGERTLYKHFLLSENELLAFLKLRDTRAESPISQNEQQPKQIPEGCAIVNVEDLINLAVSYCEDGMHPDDLERDIRAMINASPTNTEVGE